MNLLGMKISSHIVRWPLYAKMPPAEPLLLGLI